MAVEFKLDDPQTARLVEQVLVAVMQLKDAEGRALYLPHADRAALLRAAAEACGNL